MISSLTEYVGFWRRVLAFFVDALWITPLMWLLLYFTYGGDYTQISHLNTEILFEWRIILINDILPALLILWFWIKYAATPGKLLFDCEIVDAHTGEHISFKQALLRYLAYIVSLLPLGLGFLWIIWDKRKQGWHDKIAGTIVIIHDEVTVPLQKLENNFR